jgi:hypothetical protein
MRDEVNRLREAEQPTRGHTAGGRCPGDSQRGIKEKENRAGVQLGVSGCLVCARPWVPPPEAQQIYIYRKKKLPNFESVVLNFLNVVLFSQKLWREGAMDEFRPHYGPQIFLPSLQPSRI